MRRRELRGPRSTTCAVVEAAHVTPGHIRPSLSLRHTIYTKWIVQTQGQQLDTALQPLDQRRYTVSRIIVSVHSVPHINFSPASYSVSAERSGH